jgi:predicted RND superfamily exporter protein
MAETFDSRLMRDYLDEGRNTGAVFVNMPDVGSSRIQAMVDELRPKLDAIEAEMAAAGRPVQITITGMFAIGYDIFETLVDGLLASLGISLLVSYLVFLIVLRSWKLGLMALIPNVVPLTLTFGFMGLSGIQLTPTTVIVYSITLVIADDDTTQYFTRFKAVFTEMVARGERDPHRAAAIATLKESGLPMFITACAVSLGFLTLLASRFLGLAHFGLLVGVSLFTAIFGDLFLTPVMLMKFKPRIFKGQPETPAQPAPEPEPAARS